MEFLIDDLVAVDLHLLVDGCKPVLEELMVQRVRTYCVLVGDVFIALWDVNLHIVG